MDEINFIRDDNNDNDSDGDNDNILLNDDNEEEDEYEEISIEDAFEQVSEGNDYVTFDQLCRWEMIVDYLDAGAVISLHLCIIDNSSLLIYYTIYDQSALQFNIQLRMIYYYINFFFSFYFYMYQVIST